MTSRDKLFGQLLNSPTTFASDLLATNLPLPALSSTLELYYESLRPFASTRELNDSIQQIEEFERGVGQRLHAFLEERVKSNRNWVNSFFTCYVYVRLFIF